MTGLMTKLLVGEFIGKKRERRNFKNFMGTPPLFEIFLSVLGTGEGNFFQVGGAQRKRG
jgi:hypothetical protein